LSFENLVDVARATGDAIASVDQRYTDNKLARLEKQYEYEVGLAGDNVEAQKAIQKRYQEEERRIKREAARREKAYAVFQLGLQLALQLSAQNYFGAAVTAVQLAATLASPIPEFKKGKKLGDSYEGLGVFGEAGAEIMEKDGKKVIADKPTLTYVDSKTRIYTPEETAKMLEKDETEGNVVRYNTAAKTNTERMQLAQSAAFTMAMKSGFNSDTMATAIGRTVADAIKKIPVNGRDNNGYLETEIHGLKTKVLNSKKVI